MDPNTDILTPNSTVFNFTTMLAFEPSAPHLFFLTWKAYIRAHLGGDLLTMLIAS